MNIPFMPEQQHVGNPKWRGRRPEGFEPAVSNSPSGPRKGESKVEFVKQGVRGPLRAKNLRLLLDAASAQEDLAMLAEVPLGRIQNMVEGALCSDEMTYHLEQQLDLPSGWLDRMNNTVPETYLTLLANPHRHHDEDTTPSASSNTPSPPAPTKSAASSSVQVSAPHSTASVEPPQSAPSGKAAKLLKRLPANEATPASPNVAASPPPAAGGASTPTTDARQQSLLDDTAPLQSQRQEPDPVLATPLSQTNRDPAMTKSTELRLANLNVLLSGKGAKSALARLLSLSPASVTGMLNGVKPLDDDLLLNVTRALHLAEDWFEKARTEADIPAATSKLLSPLVRGAAAPAAVRKTRADFKPAAAETSGGQAAPAPSPVPATRAPPGDERPKSWPSSGSKVDKLRNLTGDSTASNQGPAHNASESSTPSTAQTARPQESVAASSGPALPEQRSQPEPMEAAAPRETIRMPARAVPEQQRGDAYQGMTAALSESVLPPIAEALIKTLAQKASSGALSEDKAFELLGSIRTL